MLAEYITLNCVRVACQCGECIDAPEKPEEKQPDGHTADLVFFKVAKTNGATKEAFEKFVKDEFPHWLNGEEHNYLEMGADIGDQGLALMAMGLGKLLDVWQLLTPKMLPIPEDLQMQMAGMGMISVKARLFI